MLPVLGDLIPYGVAMALSPLPIIAVMLLLMSPLGVRGAGAFATARLLCVAVISGGLAFFAQAIDDAAGSKGPTAVTRIVLGLVLMTLALVKWLRRPSSEEDAKIPQWMASIESSTMPRSFRLGAVLTLLNPKELAFAVGAGLAIGAGELGALEAVASVALFVILCCASVLIPIILVLLAGDKSTAILDTARNWLLRNNSIILAIVLLLIGALLVGGGLSELA